MAVDEAKTAVKVEPEKESKVEVEMAPVPLPYGMRPLAMFQPRARVPAPVIGLPDMVRPIGTVMSTEVTVPVFEVTQVPSAFLKHPAANCIPLAKVLVAVAPVTSRLPVILRPPKAVVVAELEPIDPNPAKLQRRGKLVVAVKRLSNLVSVQ